MPVETASYVSQLNANYPDSSDGADGGDNHLRLIKNVLKLQFPEFTAAALNATQAELENVIDAIAGLVAFKLIAGTAGAPAIALAADLDTGIYSPGVAQVAVSIAGARQVLVDANGLSVTSGASFGDDVAVTGGIASTGPIEGPGAWPIGMVGEWYSDSLPNSKYGTFAWCNGTTVSALTYTELAALWPSRVSSGLITLPDRRDNTAVGKATMGGAADAGLISTYGTSTLFTAIGEGTHTLSSAETPSHYHDVYLNDPGHYHSGVSYGAAVAVGGGAGVVYSCTGSTTGAAYTGITVRDASGGGGNANRTATAGSGTSHNIVQPGYVCNFVVRIA